MHLYAPGEGQRAWISVRIEPSGEPQLVADALFAFGSLGIQEDGTAIVSCFPPGTSLEALSAAVVERDPAATISFGEAPVADWSSWRAQVSAHKVGNLTIAPPWLASSLEPKSTIVIEPAMAFGTGEHATTRGVVRLMQLIAPTPRTVADLGAGSAVLAIAAGRLGASRVIAIEIDPEAIGNAEQNVDANGMEGRVYVMLGDAATLLPLIAPVQLVLANILSSVLIELMPLIATCIPPGGHAILSGILAEERLLMIDAADELYWKITAEHTEEGWWSVLLTRK
ncbi:MAG: 50S ribosomal protein L11 methyltransferase [Gemmatimonadaceae bacterium]|nr:50S ribosomal protein L11 methyltransferase [Gemmatimonadaceae bacterium]MDQ3242856.1 50S ribosomal protein L11 methyltransferase [Gemmatimonadota bacterium]